jgi:Uma2 family endonuclease
MAALPRLLTYSDLAEMPDDGLRREIIAGELLVNPAPRIRHQGILLALLEELLAFFGPERAYRPLPAPVELRITPYDVVQPDLVVLPRTFVSQQGLRNFIEEPPLLVVEILSPSTASSDRRAKMALYARFGVPEYWIVDPDRPRLDAYTLADRAYVPIDEEETGQVRSRVFPGLVVAVDSLFL